MLADDSAPPVVVLTAAFSGIGRATAQALARRGADPALASCDAGPPYSCCRAVFARRGP